MADLGDATKVARQCRDAEQMRRQTDEVIRLYGEILRRLSNQGMRGIVELAELHERVCRAALTVALPEVDYALAQIGELVERLAELGQRLARLGEIKQALLGSGADGEAAD